MDNQSQDLDFLKEESSLAILSDIQSSNNQANDSVRRSSVGKEAQQKVSIEKRMFQLNLKPLPTTLKSQV